ncbi:MAG TPA: UDP-N-acetylmuramoyl-L-alanyl-D-glutamate--2,6-diaminopimelate ligase, partial [Blastocatellia bacterium]|nr:UDP-N-acetylmuramoyl-L-alanyl-D-glutamate--2,6-diaminopimelate ligase [Blastocatellia bacterium]
MKQLNPISVAGALDAEAVDVTHDSRLVRPGSVFAAISGAIVDGNSFAQSAVESGAVAVISEHPALPLAGAWIQVHDARSALARAAAAIQGHPSRKLKLAGVTGTNGKTTTAHLIDSIIRTAERTSAMLGTINYRIGEETVPAPHTTPEASDIQRLLATAVARGCKSAVMEVSSHAIDLRRADALTFSVAVFTNLTRDHLDYHKTIDAYFEVKKRLFDGSLGSAPAASVINIDDEHGRILTGVARGNIITYGLGDGGGNGGAMPDSVKGPMPAVCPKTFNLTERGIEMIAHTPIGEVAIESTLVGRPHVYNILAATGAAIALGFTLPQIADGVRACATVAGRFERVTVDENNSPGVRVVVDYAHTDDALKNVLQTAREVAAGGRVITVFGCGGDRDRTKRAPMGEIAAALSDVVIV